MTPKYCCYCGTFLLTDSRSCETCGNRVIRQPPQEEGVETDGSDDDFYQEDAAETKFDVLAPPDHQEMIYGFIERYRGQFVHTFHFCRESDNSFIMAATMSADRDGPVFFHTRSDLNGPGSSMAQVPKRKGQQGFIAVLIPTTILGTEFIVTTKEESNWIDSLLSKAASISSKADGIGETPTYVSSSDEEGKELGLFVFDANLLGAQPNSVSATVRANPAGVAARKSIKARVASRSLSRSGADQSLFDRIRGKKDRSYRPLGQEEEDDDEVATFITKKPQWNESIGGWTLDFNGRVTISSKKNFILVPSEFDEMLFGTDTTGVRFGKVSKHKFNLDYRFPFSPVTALSLAMSMFMSKLVVAW